MNEIIKIKKKIKIVILYIIQKMTENGQDKIFQKK